MRRPVDVFRTPQVILFSADVSRAAAFEKLVADGCPPLKAPHVWLDRLLIAWTADPDGHPIQIVAPLRESVSQI
jgi:hypothetical protein